MKNFIKFMFETVNQIFCTHEYVEYNKIGEKNSNWMERWLICRKCSHHKFLKI